MPHSLRLLACSCVLAASTASQAATAWLGIDFDHFDCQLIDLAPADGIAPSLSFGPLDGRASGPGGEGPFATESFGYGTRHSTTGPGASYFVDVSAFFVDTLLSPYTAAVFSVSGFVGASASSGETAAVDLGLATRYSDRSGSIFSIADGSDISANGVSGPFSPVSDLLQLRIENRGAVSQYIDIGYTSSVALTSRNVAPVPEPSTWAMLALGVPLLLGAVQRQRGRSSTATTTGVRS